MKSFRPLLAATVAALALAACSGGGEARNEATAPEENASGSAEMNSMTSDPNNPYGQAEMQMHERMMAAVGANASESWVKKMIEHHRGAIEMSNVLLAQGGPEPVLSMARKTIADQGKEIEELERMVQAGGIGAGTSGDANPYKQSEQTMHQKMMAATGADAAETWMRKMIEHHRGAVDMSNILVAQGGDPKVLEKARMTASKQQKEIQHLEQMLAGEAMTGTGAGAPPAPTAAAPAPKAKADAPAPKAKAEPKAQPKAAPKAEPKAPPKAEPKADPTCLPEHRAAGHC
jgi:uncharacterized protein (DUF305 family)